MDIKEQLKDIKTQLRLSMNGAVSQSMREKGLLYKLNFGVELPRMTWRKPCGKKISASVRSWLPCFNRLIPFIRRLRTSG